MNSQDSIFKFIICGTDTDIGKTLISSFFVRGLNSFYWKPIQSGIESQTDSQTVKKLTQAGKEKIIKEAYVFTKPLSPHWASEIDQKTINFDKLKLPKVQGSLIVETAGGLMVPITRNFLQIDQIKQWNLPIILVCKSSLGTLNHTLLSIEALNRRNIEILGLIVNGEKHLDNPKTLVDFSGIPLIAEFPYIKKMDSNNLDILWKELDIKNKLISLLNSKIS
ncbi:Dethiobiotin synthetase [Prochlorococcus marinus str. MIT 9321]|uniref:ATP-dependent dethiobiotin synthetase BioD n=1 Tax=Prochlorococcus marinus str. MIT 9401 TaxID=167551 RepID=A0A0A2B7F6_PROMR|nr:dethiobiotin synthase [Prochlorococcus marinus]KGG02595.1 Dethiobiotin synthetase [Prochlorococcus marinus str. MIT 9321]KGG05230.1 Dethiobiotin synthetase [Prochlorococcus marinus str. MIT 9322]KGG10013.1 Dethiobiotin synthetase [Prochlorococcus marinus str. MIT 9401]